jgi:hypothetical protein
LLDMFTEQYSVSSTYHWIVWAVHIIKFCEQYISLNCVSSTYH